MSYTMYTPLNVWLDPASITDVVAYIQTYLSENTIYSETEIETIIHDYLIAHPELIGGVQSVNGKTGTVVLTASDINTQNNVTIESVLASLSSQISSIASSVATNTDNITTAETDISNLKSSIYTTGDIETLLGTTLDDALVTPTYNNAFAGFALCVKPISNISKIKGIFYPTNPSGTGESYTISCAIYDSTFTPISSQTITEIMQQGAQEMEFEFDKVSIPAPYGYIGVYVGGMENIKLSYIDGRSHTLNPDIYFGYDSTHLGKYLPTYDGTWSNLTVGQSTQFTLSFDIYTTETGEISKIDELEEKVNIVANEHPQLLISIIDDDTNYVAPTIWNAILSGNSDVKIGFACMTGYVNGTYTDEGQFKPMSLADLKTFYNDGHEVYSHGWAGYSVGSLTELELASECWKSKDWLFNNGFVRGIDTFVYSGGTSANETIFNTVRGYYKFGVNSYGGVNTNPIQNPMYIKRIFGDTATLASLETAVDSFLTTGGLLVFGFHSYELNKDSTNNIQKVRDLIAYIKNTNAKIVPFERAMKSIYGLTV